MKLMFELIPELFNFPNLYDERVEIENFLHRSTEKVTEIKELPLWEICFLSSLGKGNMVGVSKKGYTYPSEHLSSEIRVCQHLCWK
jgi:hypothetical protein